MEKNDDPMAMFNALPDNIKEIWVRELVRLTLARSMEGKVLTSTKKFTTFVTHIFQWFVYGTGIAGCMWLITWLLTNIKSMVGW